MKWLKRLRRLATRIAMKLGWLNVNDEAWETWKRKDDKNRGWRSWNK